MSKADHICISGFGLSGYRSFGSKTQRFGPFGKINLIIGQNNAGKSNVLRFIHEHYLSLVQAFRHDHQVKLNPIDRFRTQQPFDPVYSLACHISKEQFQRWRDELGVRRLIEGLQATLQPDETLQEAGVYASSDKFVF